MQKDTSQKNDDFFQPMERLAKDLFLFFKNVPSDTGVEFEIKSAFLKKTYKRDHLNQQLMKSRERLVDLSLQPAASHHKINAGLGDSKQYQRLHQTLVELYSNLGVQIPKPQYLMFVKYNHDLAFLYRFATDTWEYYVKEKVKGRSTQVNLISREQLYRVATSAKVPQMKPGDNQKISHQLLEVLNSPIKEQRCFRIMERISFPVSKGQGIELSKVAQFFQEDSYSHTEVFKKLIKGNDYKQLEKYIKEDILTSKNYPLQYESQYVLEKNAQIESLEEAQLSKFIKDRMRFFSHLNEYSNYSQSKEKLQSLQQLLNTFINQGKSKVALDKQEEKPKDSCSFEAQTPAQKLDIAKKGSNSNSDAQNRQESKNKFEADSSSENQED